MATEQEYQDLLDRMAALEEQLSIRLADQLVQNPQLADVLNRQVNAQYDAVVAADARIPPPHDLGSAQLIGVGPDAAQHLARRAFHRGSNPTTRRLPQSELSPSATYITSFNTNALASSASCRSCRNCSDAGAVRLSSGPGAYSLYQFDRREKSCAIRSATGSPPTVAVLGYGSAAVPQADAPIRLPSPVHALYQPNNSLLA